MKITLRKMFIPDAFYVAMSPTSFQSTVRTIGPWSAKAQHAGPPAALLCRAIELKAQELKTPFISRFTSSIFKPVPIAPLDVQVEIIRSGKKVSHLSASLSVNGCEIMRAFAVCSRIDDTLRLPPCPKELPPTPKRGEPYLFPIHTAPVGYHNSIALELVEGVHQKGPTTMWLKPLFPLVDGETSSSTQRAIIVGDCANGIGFHLDFATTFFMNSDLSVVFHRPLLGEWFAMASRVDVAPLGGVGSSFADMFDETGHVGRLSQTLLLEARL